MMVGLPVIAILSACAATQEVQEIQGPLFELKPAPQTPVKFELKPPENSPYLLHKVTWPHETLYLIFKFRTPVRGLLG